MSISVPAGPDLRQIETALASLIACDTTFPPGAGYAAIAELIESLFAALGGTSEAVELPDLLWAASDSRGVRRNLLLRPALGADDRPEAMIYFHTDTAPAGDGWTREPLRLTREGTRLYGRGTADMKGAIAATLDALTRLALTGAPLAYRPVLAFCTDEEGGRHPGIRYLAETRSLPDVLLNLNGSAEPRIWGGCLGSMDLILNVTGRSAHSGDPDRGRSAIALTMPALSALEALKHQVESRTTTLVPPPWTNGPLRARLNVTAIHAGDKGSLIPGRCRVTINRRYLPEEDEDAVREEIERALEAALGESLAPADRTVELAGHLPPVTDPDGPDTRRWTLARARAFGLPESAFVRHASGSSSDFGWVQRAGHRHMLLGGLMRPDRNVHGPDEFTTDDDLAALSRAIELFLSAEFDPEVAPGHSPHASASRPPEEITS